MRPGMAIMLVSLTCVSSNSSAAEPPGSKLKVEPATPSPRTILRDASELALRKDLFPPEWMERVLLHIGEEQIRAGDFDGALKSFRGSTYQYARDMGLIKLAQAMAGDGKRARAFEVLRLVSVDHCRDRDSLDDHIQLKWIEHLIVAGDRPQAEKAIAELRSPSARAVAFSKAGENSRSVEQFKLAIDAAVNLKEDYDRARALWEIGGLQLSVGDRNGAKATVRLVEAAEFKNAWAKASALREAAVLSAKAKDDKNARRLFEEAIQMDEGLEYIVEAQANSGYFNDARKMALKAKDGDKLGCIIAKAQVKANDIEGALQTVLALNRGSQYLDEALQQIVNHQVAKGDLRSALATAKRFENSSLRAAAMLNVARAHAIKRELKEARDIALQIELRQSTPYRIRGETQFDFRQPQSWAEAYEPMGGGLSQMLRCFERAAKVGAAAMTLAQALHEKPAKSYAVLFDQVTWPEIIEALARAHAASGIPSEALEWAKKIGGGEKINSNDDATLRAVERRIRALMGVAEGILDRQGRPRLSQE